MAFTFSFGVVFLLSVWSAVKCDDFVEGVLQMECHDRYFMIAVDVSVTGEDPRFEAVDRTGAYPLTEQYAAECGYSLNVLPFLGLVELRASYFSCYTEKEDDVYMFNFNLITTLDGEDTIYALNRTCSPPLPWSSREVTCEVNYMEVSVRGEAGCLSGVYNASTSEWQVVFHRPDEQLPPMNFSKAREQGYMFDVTDERVVFRTLYGQPNAYNTEVNGVPVEVVHASVFLRQSWVVLMVDLVAACSMYEGSHEGGNITWETPEALYPSLNGMQISVGLNGDLVEQTVDEQKGLIMEKHNTTIHISIPYNVEGGHRRSFVKGAIFEFYVFHLYIKQVLVDEDHKETVLRCHRIVVTPLVPCELVTDDKTVLEEGMFTIYLGHIPEDVDLTSIQLNGQESGVPFNNESTRTITEATGPNNTHSYTLKVPFDDPVVVQEFSREYAAMLHKLDVNYTLTVPGSDPYYHTASFVALLDVSPPAFETNCTSSGISFKLDHRPFDYLWQISIGSDLLTPELVAERGYIMTNNSQNLLLDVPLFTRGYEYRDVTLNGFLGTFGISVRDHETGVHASSVRTCPFNSRDFIMCSTDGRMTVVADLSMVIPSGEMPASFHLRNELCQPNEVNSSRMLFSFPVNSCGAIVKLVKGNVTYENKIFYSLNPNHYPCDNDTEGVTVQCTYPLASLHRLFSVYTFESDMEGVGSIIYTVQPTAGPSPTEPTSILQTTASAQRTRSQSVYLPAYYPASRYIKVSRVQHPVSPSRKGNGYVQQSVVLV